jgi:hypothetical protein
MIKTPKHFFVLAPQQLQKRRRIPRNQETRTTARAQEMRMSLTSARRKMTMLGEDEWPGQERR